MSPKNDKYSKFLFGPLWLYLVHFGHIGPILSTSVLFGPHQSYLVHFVHFSSIQLTLVLFSLTWSNLVLFGLICSYLVHYVHFGPNLLIRSYSVPFGPLQFYSVHCSVQSISVLSGPPCSHLVIFYPFGPFVSTSVHFFCTYIQGKDMLGLIMPILN